MSSAVLATAYWPPAPSVEDETESLAREVPGSSGQDNDDRVDASVPCKGPVDQSPVIIALQSTIDNERPEEDGCLAEIPNLLPERRKSRSTEGSSPIRKTGNRVRFAEAFYEHDQADSEAYMTSYSRSTVSRRRTSRNIVQNGSEEPYRNRFSRDPSDLENPHERRRPSSWYLPQQQSYEGDIDPERTLEWFSDDELSSHSGQYWADHPARSPRAKKMVNFRTPSSPTGQAWPISSRGRQERGYSCFKDNMQSDYQGRSKGTPVAHGKYPSYRRSRTEPVTISDRLRLDSDDAYDLANPGMMSLAPSSGPQELYSHQRRSPPGQQRTHLLEEIWSKPTRPRRSTAPTGELTHRQPDAHAMHLSPCSKSIPMAGGRDWHTIIGLTHLNICPACMNQIGGSRFRNFFIPSPPKPAGTMVSCSLSQPWARLAWIQTIKLGLNHLGLLHQITRPTPDGERCSGWSSSVQTWYRASDPETGWILSEFNACSPCFRKLQILLPSLRGEFVPQRLAQQSHCDLWPNSPRFLEYLSVLDAVNTRCLYDPESEPDLRDFVRYSKRKSTINDCPRDHLLIGPWHYIPELPEFTICEDCYDDVVWPLSQHPIANRVGRTLQRLPSSRAKYNGPQQASCQLYSPRMRAIFREAVRLGDFSYFRAAVLNRYEAEYTFREQKKVLLGEMARGYDRDAQLRRNADRWKHSE